MKHVEDISKPKPNRKALLQMNKIIASFSVAELRTFDKALARNMANLDWLRFYRIPPKSVHREGKILVRYYTMLEEGYLQVN